MKLVYMSVRNGVITTRGKSGTRTALLTKVGDQYLLECEEFVDMFPSVLSAGNALAGYAHV